MFSLALIVCIIFLTVILSGPLSLIFSYFDFYYLTVLFGLLSIISGIFWTFASPFPVCIAGIISACCGIFSIDKIIN
jgi:hypothetical protein